jgi:hypothetical protein
VGRARRSWFKVASSIYREPWDPDEKLCLVLLSAYLNDRWARDGLTADQACEATLDLGAMFSVTGKKRADSALRVLEQLANRITLSVHYEDGRCSIKWPKFAEFQGMRVHEGPQEGTPRNTQYAVRRRNTHKHSSSEPTSGSLLVNLLSKYPGTSEQKQEWLSLNLPLIELEVEKEGYPTKRRVNAAIKSMVIRWYRYQTEPKRKDAVTKRRFEGFSEDAARRNDEWVENLKQEISGNGASRIPSDV